MRVLGIDIGVRSIHVAAPKSAISLSVERTHRGDEIRNLMLQYEAYFGGNKKTVVFCEEPLVAGRRNLRTALQMAQVVGAVMLAHPTYLVPVSTWKKEVVGKGNASKEEVHEFLKDKPGYYYTEGSQDLVDATCIRMYGLMQLEKTKT